MRLGAVLILALGYLFSPAESSIGETDVIRVFQPRGKIPLPQMRALLAKADLVSAGFTKTEETHIVTGEDGKQQKKLVISYTVQDACSNVSFWEETIRVRLPIISKRLTRKVISEVEKRIDNRTTEYCRFGIEVHINPYSHAGKEKARRRLYDESRLSCDCCCKTDIKYTPVNY